MDTTTQAIVTLAVWFVLREILAVAAYLITVAVFTTIAGATKQKWIAILGFILGAFAGLGVAIWGIVQIVTSIVTLVHS